MPISEESYADRHARATVLCEEIAGFVPPFTPVDTDLEAAAFDTFCGLVLAANTAVAATFNDWRTATEERQLMVKEIKLTATRVVSFLKSSAQFASRLPVAKSAADRLRGVRPKKPTVPEGEEPEPTRNRGDQSYADIAKHLETLTDAVTGLAGYTPLPITNPITVVNLDTTIANYRAKNTEIIGLEGEWRQKVRDRLTIYEGTDGLRAKMTAIKNAVKAQYGQNSDQYLAVKGIKL